MSDKHNRPYDDNFDTEGFVGGVLDRTSGQACERAVTQLGDLMAERLTGLDRQLVQAHLEHCPGCRRLAVTLGWLTPLLPVMAEIDPGPEFLAGVLSRTTAARRPVVHAEHPAGLAGLMDRVGRWWEQRILRPDFALQVAYVATVVLVLLTVAPGSPLRGVPGQALEMVTAGPQTAPIIGPAMTGVSDWVESSTTDAVTAGRGRVTNRWQRINMTLTERAGRTTGSRRELQLHWQTMIDQAQARELGSAGYELLATLRTWNVVWDQWWHEIEPTSGP